MVARAIHLIIGASDIALDGGVRFSREFSVMVSAFAPGQVLNFGSLAYITDCYGELHLHHRAVMAGNEPPVSSPLLGPSRADLEVQAQQIRRSLGPDPTM